MAKAKIAECKSCVFWARNRGGDPDEGMCHRFPPIMDVAYMLSRHEAHQIDGDEGMVSSGWKYPITQADEWCGEFRQYKGRKS